MGRNYCSTCGAEFKFNQEIKKCKQCYQLYHKDHCSSIYHPGFERYDYCYQCGIEYKQKQNKSKNNNDGDCIIC